MIKVNELWMMKYWWKKGIAAAIPVVVHYTSFSKAILLLLSSK